MTCGSPSKCVVSQLVLWLGLATPAVATPVITEFMAANARSLADSDGDFSDWIELHNPDATAVNLAGWYLTDDAGDKNRWQFPDITLPAGGYLVVFASDKNRRDPAGQLHTNFLLDASGEYLGLVMPDGRTVASEFAPKYPEQNDDISYGITQPGVPGEAPRTGYFRTPTPGAPNGGAETLMPAERVTLSRTAGPFTGTITVAMSGAAPGQHIRYVLGPPAATGVAVAEPAATATEYTGPITIDASVILRAAVFSADNSQHGLPTTAHYLRVGTAGATRVDTFASQLPLLVIDTHGAGPLAKDGLEHPALLYTWNRPAGGGTALTAAPSAASSLAINVRGTSSAEFPKKGYALRLVDNDGKSNPLPLYGLPSFDNWVLSGPWSFDRTFLHNVLVYDLSNRLGRWAPRTQPVEVFFNANGGDLDYSDYAGVYILTDALRVDPKRIDIAAIDSKDLSGSAITGGYVLKVDVWSYPDEFSFRTRRNFPADPFGIVVTTPKAADLPPAQRDYIQGYVQSFEDALYADAATGWRQRTHLDYIDRSAWVDHHILNVLAMNVDAFERSAYLTKDRRGPLVAGPVWDYDRSLGGGDDRTAIPNIWNAGGGAIDLWTFGWWGVLAHDPEFMQAWIERWQKLRKNEFSNANLSARVDGLAAQIGALAGARDAARWPDNASRFIGGWQGEIDNLKSWLAQRCAWIDSQFTAEPALTNSSGTITLAPAPGTQVAYTLDGSDPRLFGGGLSNSARLSATPVTLPDATILRARGYRPGVDPGNVPGNPWSSAVGTPGRLINLSILTDLPAGNSFTMGFVVGGAGTSGTKALLARAAGPSLAQFGVVGAHPDPKLEFFTGVTKITENDNWAGAAAISSVFAQVGAFAYTSAAAKDAAVFNPAVASGNNSVVVSGIGNASGTVIAELYDATPAGAFGATTPRLVNVSVLKRLGPGLTAGFVIVGGSPRTVLVRAIGPTLGAAPFNLSGVASDPQLALFGSSGKIAGNDEWGGTAALAAAFASVGAFALPNGSRDAALLATLSPGNYTVQVSGSSDNSGTALVEIYEVP